MKKEEKKNKINLREMWKDKKGRAKIELALYGIFFLVIVIFIRMANTNSSSEIDNSLNSNFISDIQDNYEYNMEININDNIYKYYGKYLGYNGTITREVLDDKEFYYMMNNKYYILDNNGNYILTSKEDVYRYIDYKYLDINNIKEYMKVASVSDDIYTIKLSDIILNSNSSDNITITIDEENTSLVIDYTNLFKLDDSSINKVLVTISYKNINNIISLEE